MDNGIALAKAVLYLNASRNMILRANNGQEDEATADISDVISALGNLAVEATEEALESYTPSWLLGDEMRVRDVPQQSNGASILPRESSGQSLTM